MKIYLAGDSIVQNYADDEFIAGWGQYLPLYFMQGVQIVNCAKGGRSSRLFINEGRLDKITSDIKAGDYLFIEFCHNDDSTKEYKTMFNRLTPLGAADASGIYPVIPGEPASKRYLPQEYLDKLFADDTIHNKQAVLDEVYRMFDSYPKDQYYPYSEDGSKGTYKWFLKQYIDAAERNGAIPVLVTAPARTVFDENGYIQDGAGLHGGNNFSYIRAMRQLAEETDTAVLDLFEYSCDLYRSIGKNRIGYIMSVKKGINKGVWPQDFESQLLNSETVIENTHFNKYGAYLMAKGIVRLLAESKDKQLDKLKNLLIKDIDGIYEQAPSGLLR